MLIKYLNEFFYNNLVALDGSEREIGFLLKRLFAVTNGDEAKEVFD
jgi:hypothetical protein